MADENSPDCDGDRTPLVIVPFDLLHLLAQADEMTAKHLLGFSGQAGCAFSFTVGDVSLHFVEVDFPDNIIVLVRPVHMDVHDVPGDRLVAVLVMLVLDNEDHVETRQNGSLEVDVL